MTAKSPTDASLTLTLPATTYTQAETILISNFTVDGNAIDDGFINDERGVLKRGADGTSEFFVNPDIARYIEFSIVPFSEIDKKLIKFNGANSKEPMIIQYKNSASELNLYSEAGFFSKSPPTISKYNPDDKVYRLEMGTYIIT